MEECLIHDELAFVTDHEPTEVPDPSDGSFDLPASLVSAQLASVLGWGFDAVGFVRADQFDSPLFQAFAQRVGVGGFVVDQSFGVLARPTASAGSGHGYPVERRLDQRRFVRGRRGELNSQRNTLAACHHHPLRTLATFGFSDGVAPFFAEAKLPSAKVSSQSNRPCSSSLPRNCCHRTCTFSS